MEQANSIGFQKNWKDRRLTSLDEWGLEKRQAIPDEGNLTTTVAMGRVDLRDTDFIGGTSRIRFTSTRIFA